MSEFCPCTPQLVEMRRVLGNLVNATLDHLERLPTQSPTDSPEWNRALDEARNFLNIYPPVKAESR